MAASADESEMGRAQRAVAVENLFPPGVIAFEIRGVASPDDLFPSERDSVARAVERRVREFAAGRLCARAGLTELGLNPTPLLPAQDRAPMWPSGIVGSITHTDSCCVAVVSQATKFAAIGVDAECIRDVSPSLWRLTMRAEELSRLQSLEEAACRQMAAVTWCAKEAFYKCQYALTRSWLGFEDVIVDVVADAFEVSVVNATHPIQHMLSPWIGRFKVDEAKALVVAGIAAERYSRSRRRIVAKRRRRVQSPGSPG